MDFACVKDKFASVYEYDALTGETKALYTKTMQISRAFYYQGGITVCGTFGKEVGWIESPKFYDLVDGEIVAGNKEVELI